MSDHAERLAKLQLRQAKRLGQSAPEEAAPAPAPAAPTAVQSVVQAPVHAPAPVPAEAARRPERPARGEGPARKKRPHAAAPARIIVTALAASVFVMLMSFMGPLAKLNETEAANAGADPTHVPIVVQIRREVAAAPPDPSLGLPGHLDVNGEPIDLAFLEEFHEDEDVAMVTGGPVPTTAAPVVATAPAAPVAAAPAAPVDAPADTAAPAPAAAPATTAAPPPPAPAPAADAPPPRTEASG